MNVKLKFMKKGDIANFYLYIGVEIKQLKIKCAGGV